MALDIDSTVRLNNGVKMPWLGLGTWRSAAGEESKQSVLDALDLGYRHIDTAAIYKNEESVGDAIRDSRLPRESLFVTTKVWNDDLRSGRVLEACEASLKKLGLDYVDLYLIHWPVAGKFVEAWRKLEELYRQGKARSIGVSNFLAPHLDAIAEVSQVTPAVNQIEFHPRLQQPELIARCKQAGIAVEAWSPLMQGKFGEVPELIAIAGELGKSPAQVALRWALQKGVVVIPKSVRRERLEENAALYDFALTAQQIAQIDALDRQHRFGPDPAHFDF